MIKNSKIYKRIPKIIHDSSIFNMDVEKFLDAYKKTDNAKFDLVITSPPYNIGKEYEDNMSMQDYILWQKRIIEKIIPLVSENGSICWQVGFHKSLKGTGKQKEILPLDYLFYEIFKDLNLKLRNRIIWSFGHGFHNTYSFSGRHETVLWYTKSDNYIFNLDNVRVPSKYPGKTHYRGPKKGLPSSNPLGKNPGDVWDNIPNVKALHIEKTDHPCQFPVGLVERLMKALTNEGGLVFDPFAGVSSTGVACALFNRKYIGCEIMSKYCKTGKLRISDTLRGIKNYRPHDKKIYDHKKSYMSKPMKESKIKEIKERKKTEVKQLKIKI